MRALNRLFSFLPVAIAAVLLSACGDEESIAPEEGLVLTKHHIETELPCFVHIMFQVTNLAGSGIDTLETSSFEVREDGESVSPTESAMHVRKRDVIPYTLKTVLMIDNSASVGPDLADIKSAAIGLINSMTTQQLFAVYEFSENPILLQDFTDDISLLTAAVDGIELGYPSTNLYGSIIEGVSKWEDIYSSEEVQQGYLIILTDGSDTQGSHTLSEALEARGSKKVYTVGMGDEIDNSVLERLGNEGFFPIEDVEQLAALFTTIQDEMALYANSFYWLNYMSPKRGDLERTLRLEVRDNPHSSYIEGTFWSTDFYSVLQGVYVNTTSENPYGLDTLYAAETASVVLNAVTYLGNAPPQYQWQSEDPDVIVISPDPHDGSKATCTVAGESGQTASITVNDVANSFSRSIAVVVGPGYYQGFEEALGSEWELVSNQGLDRIVRSTDDSHAGEMALKLDATTPTYCRNEAILSIDLSSIASAVDCRMSFWAKAWSASQSSHATVYITSDGSSWLPVLLIDIPDSAGASWSQTLLNLRDYRADHPFSTSYRIKWQQEGFYDTGFYLYLDDIEVVASGLG